MKVELVSVIIPVYQVSDYVERCLKSVMSQTYTDIECIIVDDATKDDSIVKCERLIREYNENLKGGIRFKILHHEVNRGLSAARNTGTKAATGEYVFYLDSDDEMTPDCMEKMMLMAEKYPEAEMVVGRYQTIENGNVRSFQKGEVPDYVVSNEKIVSLYYTKCIPIFAWNKLMKRSFIEAHKLCFKEGIVYEDDLWMFHVVKYLSAVAFLNEVTYHYYIRPGSILTSHDEFRKGESYKIIYSEILANLTPGRENKDLERYVAGFCKCYLDFKSSIPEYHDLHREFMERSKHHDCWSVYLILITIRIIGYFGNPSRILECLNALRWKWKRMTISVKTI
jgi:glycosyltransferase involved in cell wall biosynthesis